MKPLHSFFIILGFLFLPTDFVFAKNMSESEIYQRCHLRLARQLPPAGDALAAEVKNGRRKAADACLALLRTANFDASGKLANYNDQRARMIIKTMHDFHRTYFQARKNEVLQNGSYLIRDGEEAPLYLTRALFLPRTSFSSVVTLEYGLSGVRQRAADRPMGSMSEFTSNPIARYGTAFPRYGDRNLSVSYPFRAYVEGTIGLSLALPETGPVGATGMTGSTGITGSTGSTGSTGTPTPAVVLIDPPPGHIFKGTGGTFGAAIENSVEVPEIVSFGQLVGVQPAKDLILPNFFPLTPNAVMRGTVATMAVTFNANRHFGGGIVGSQNFIANNSNLVTNQLTNGVGLINRRLSNRIYEDLLCHQMPSLFAEDVAAEVDPKSPHPFQNGASCMQCHSSIDPLAYGYRNIASFRTTMAENLKGLPITGFHALPVVANANLFAATAPEGRLMYRRLLDGGLQKRNFKSIPEIGQALASERDLYLCAAKKYYNFFTGVNVNLVRQADTDVERKHQEAVLDLAKGLQKTQSLEAMIGEIFSSDIFQTRNLKSVEAQQ